MPLGASRVILLAKAGEVTAAAEVIRKKRGVFANGNAQIDTGQKAFGGTSALFDGTEDWLEINDNPIPDSGDFTVEFYFRPASVGTLRPLWSNRDSGGTHRGTLYINTSSQLTWWNGSDNVNYLTPTLSVNTWYHIACVQDGGTRRLFVDGDGVSATSSFTPGDIMEIGAAKYTGTVFSNELDGHIDEFRVSSVARYKGNFARPSVPFGNDEDTTMLLHCDGTDGSTFFDDDNGASGRHARHVLANNNAQVDTAQSKFGSASALFDGTDDYLSIGDPGSSGVGVIPLTGEFTLECWVRFNTNTNYRAFITQYGYNGQSNPTGRTALYLTNGNKFALVLNGGGFIQGTTSSSTGVWYHIAASRDSGGTTRLFVNGTEEGTNFTSSAPVVSSYTTIGSLSNSQSFDMDGHIDEIRVSNTARYTANFTPPTDVFTNDKNTTLLLHCNGADGTTGFLDDNGNRPAVGLQPAGDVHISTDQSKFGNTSIEFDGSGDYLNIPAYSPLQGREDNSLMELRGDFTLEAWVRLDINNATQGIICGADTSPYHAFSINGDGKLNWQTPYMLSTTVLSTGTWHHIAYVRDGITGRLFVNGSQEVTSTDSQVGDTIFPGPTDAYNVFIGRDAFSSYFNGYMTDVRISRSARYTATFTAPTEPFVNDDDTMLLLHGTGTNNSTLFQDDNGMTRARADVQSINGAAIDTANYQWGGASAEFDDSNDYLELPFSKGNFAGDFTVECWMDTNDTLGEFMACQKQGTAEGWTFITRSLGRLVWTSTTDGSTASALLSSNSAWSDNTWVHIAVCHNNSTGLTEMFANGTRVGSRTEQNPKTVTSGGYFRIGGNIYGVSSGNYSDGPRYFGGHLDDVRISDTVRYSGASYTVPTGPFQNDSNTVLLLPMNGSDGLTDFTDDNGMEKN